MSGTAPVLATGGLTAGYRSGRRRRRVVRLGPASVTPGEIVAVLGVNGAGKSTLLRTLIGLAPPLEGAVTLAGRPLHEVDRAESARLVAVVSSERPDPGLLRVEEVVALGRHPHTGRTGRLGAEDDAVVAAAIEATGATALVGRRLAQLSDGERQRVMIARALAQEPSLLVLDEPTAFLDMGGRVMVHELAARLAREQGLAVLLATHDVELALEIARTVWLVDGGGVCIGTVEQLRPAVDAVFGTGGRLLARA